MDPAKSPATSAASAPVVEVLDGERQRGVAVGVERRPPLQVHADPGGPADEGVGVEPRLGGALRVERARARDRPADGLAPGDFEPAADVRQRAVASRSSDVTYESAALA